MRSNKTQHRPQWLVINTALWLTLAAAQAFSQDDFFNAVTIDLPRQSETTTPYSLFGWVTEKVGFGLEAPSPPFSRQNRELNKVETGFFGQFDAALTDDISLRISGKAYHDAIYTLNDDTNYSANERNKFHTRYEIKDLFLERQFDGGAYLKVGNQILAWGLAEYSRVTDLINTEDQLTFGQQDLEDIRLQVPAALLSFNLGDWTLDSVLSYEAGRNDTAPAGDEFDQFLRMRESGITLSREQADQQYESFIRASTHWSRGDLQIVAGDFNDNGLSVTRIEAAATANPRVIYSQNRMRAFGIAANMVNGSWLYFGELGIHQDKAVRPTTNVFFNQNRGWAQKDQILSVMGIEYTGFRNLVLSFEIDNTHTRQHDKFMLDAQDQMQFGTRLYWTALNDRLQLIAVWSDLADADTNITRVSVDYSWSDSLKSGLLWMNYSSHRDSLFYDYRNNDILQLQLQYSFQI